MGPRFPGGGQGLGIVEPQFDKFLVGTVGGLGVAEFDKEGRAAEVGGHEQVFLGPVEGIDSLIIGDGFLGLAEKFMGLSQTDKGPGVGASAGFAVAEKFLELGDGGLGTIQLEVGFAESGKGLVGERVERGLGGKILKVFEGLAVILLPKGVLAEMVKGHGPVEGLGEGGKDFFEAFAGSRQTVLLEGFAEGGEGGGVELIEGGEVGDLEKHLQAAGGAVLGGKAIGFFHAQAGKPRPVLLLARFGSGFAKPVAKSLRAHKLVA